MGRLSQLLCACDDGVLTEEGLHEAATLAEQLGRTEELFDALNEVVGLEQRLQAVAPASRVRPVGTLAWLIGVRIACRRAARRAAKRALRWARILRMLWPQPQRTA